MSAVSWVLDDDLFDNTTDDEGREADQPMLVIMRHPSASGSSPECGELAALLTLLTRAVAHHHRSTLAWVASGAACLH